MMDKDKKRCRDRRAQQNMRTKRLAHTRDLEARLISAEGNLHQVQRAYNALVSEHAALQMSLGVETLDNVRTPLVVPNVAPVNTVSPFGAYSVPMLDPARRIEQTPANNGQTSLQSSRCSPEDNPDFQVQVHLFFSEDTADLVLPRWHVTPCHAEGDMTGTDLFSLWIARPDLVRDSPETPQPVEMAFGSHTNFLANVIHAAIRKWPCGEGERLAGGWLAYHLIKWMTQPNERLYTNLLPFQRPVPEQLCNSHPYFVDFIVWPQFRRMLVEKQHLYDPVLVAAELTCSLKLGWASDQSPLEFDDKGELRFNASFQEAFSKTDSWYLSRDFAIKFPMLMDGLDRNVCIRH